MSSRERLDLQRFLRHFSLASEPFSLTPDPRFLYLSTDHSEALAGLDLGILERRGLVVLTGEVGTGKTTLARTLISSVREGLQIAYVSVSNLPFQTILEEALDQLGVTPYGRKRSDLFTALRDHLWDVHAKDETVVLIVDEAQCLSAESMEELRLLLNLETNEEKLLQLVLIGQPELEAKLKQREFRQVADRVSTHCHIGPLSRRDSRSYVAHRLECAGGRSNLFSAAAMAVLVPQGRGVPRQLNVLCHNALLFAFGRGRRQVDLASALRAIQAKQAPRKRAASLAGLGRAVLTARLVWLAVGLGLGWLATWLWLM